MLDPTLLGFFSFLVFADPAITFFSITSFNFQFKLSWVSELNEADRDGTSRHVGVGGTAAPCMQFYYVRTYASWVFLQTIYPYHDKKSFFLEKIVILSLIER